ncbi:glycosyltransferase family 2 protein [Lichenicoccus sp.]|uniref:glycosyltransferase family 2 protein n=1 Tax=Lichenicoccus sp. TaxID=2781899 RepID=UPI003D11E4F5
MVMLKNERTLTSLFIGYHAALFRPENMFVFDNGSTDPEVLAALERLEAQGGHVERRFTSAGDFRRKGTVLGDLIKQLDHESDYDFYVPLDCDEFVVLRTGDGFTAEPDRIHAYLDAQRGARDILHVTLNLSNLLGTPDGFRPALYSKTIYPRDSFLHMDHGYHTGVVHDGSSPYRDCDLVYAHFHYRPYEEVVEFARQKLRMELTDAQINDHAFLQEFRGMGRHMVPYIIGGAEAYYRQFRNASRTVDFPELEQHFEILGLGSPFRSFRLPAPSVAPVVIAPAPPLLVVDEASIGRVRGWAMDAAAPEQPLFLRFLVDGTPVWEGPCDQPRKDVRDGGHPSERVGFSFAIPAAALGQGSDGGHRLTIQDRRGAPVRMSFERCAQFEIALRDAPKPVVVLPPIESHIDVFRNGRIQGWVLRNAGTPEGGRRSGGCTVALVHEDRVVAQVKADLVRRDVARAMLGEAECGFVIEVPGSLLALNRKTVLRLFLMPEWLELSGSPCVAAPSFANAAQARA